MMSSTKGMNFQLLPILSVVLLTACASSGGVIASTAIAPTAPIEVAKAVTANTVDPANQPEMEFDP